MFRIDLSQSQEAIVWPMSSTSKNSLSRGAQFKGKAARRNRVAAFLPALLLLGSGVLLADAERSDQVVPRFQEFLDTGGAFANVNLGAPTNTTINGRSCVSCHQPSDAFSVTPPHLR